MSPFANPRALWMTPIVMAAVVFFLWWSWRKRQALVRLFISERLLPQLLEGYSPQRQKIRMSLVCGAVFFAMLALAQPQWGFVWEEASQRGRDVLIAIDTSRSMLAEDMAPNRLTRAKLAALDLLRLAQNDRLGLIAFAGGAFLQCPLTLDDEAFRQNVNSLDTSIIPQGGTALTEAITTAQSAFASEEGENHRVLIIFSDGEDHEQGVMQAAQDAADHNMKVFTVGVGTPAGEVLKITDDTGNTTYIRDAAGNPVKSRLNEDLLRQIATTGNGFYLPLREGNAMKALYERGLQPLPTSEMSSKLVRHLNEQFPWPLGAAIALLLAEVLLPAAPKKRSLAITSKKTALLAALLLMAGLTVEASPARAYRNYKSGQFKDARNEYEELLRKKPDDPRLSYNAGAANYRAGSFDAAVKNFENAIKAEDLNLQEAAYYNLGNAHYRLGTDQTEADKKMALWHQAVQNFESALKLNPQDKDAEFNRDLVKKELEKLKQEQKQKNQDKNDNKDQNKEDKDQDQKQKKDNEEQKQDEKKEQKNKSEQQKQDEQQKKDEEQKKQEQQQQQKQDGEPKKDNPQQNQNQANKEQKQDEKEQAEEEARAAKMAAMTPRQAQQLLDAQKFEERALIYRPPGDKKKSRDRMFKDW